MKTLKACGHCQTQFAGRPNRDYCSEKCKRDAHKARQLPATSSEPVSVTARPAEQRVAKVLSTAYQRPSLAVVQAQAKHDEQVLDKQLANQEAERQHQLKLQQRQHHHELALKKAASLTAPPPVATLALPTPLETAVDLPFLTDQPEPASPVLTQPVQQEPEATDEAEWDWPNILLVGGFVYGVVKLFTPQPTPPVARPSSPPTETLDEFVNRLSQRPPTKPAPDKGNA